MNLNRSYLFALAAMTLLIFALGCSDRNPADLETARATIDPLVYDDDLSPDVYFQPFFETHYTAMSQDSVYAFDGFAPDGARSLKFNVPAPGSALGPYMGGVLTSSGSRDLADFNALTFYARSNASISMNTVGFGNDNTGNSLYDVSRDGSNGQLPLTGDWQFFIVPVPAPSKLISERGMFLIAEGAEDGNPDGYDIWIDEIKFARLSNMEWTRSSMGSDYQNVFVGTEVILGSTYYTNFKVDGQTTRVNHSPYYFDFTSSDPEVVAVERGAITAVGTGQARITGTLENQKDSDNPHDVLGFVLVDVFEPPTVAAASPTFPAGDVVSLFSATYTDIPVETWRADWSTAGYQEYVVEGVTTKMYTSLGYASILFHNNPVNTTDLTHFHLDAFGPAGTDITIKLACVPGEDWTNTAPPQVVINLDGDTLPAFTAGSWSALDIPLAEFQLDATTQPEDFDWTAVYELIISTGPTGDTKMVLVDNVLFRK